MKDLNQYRVQYYLGTLQNKKTIDESIRKKLKTYKMHIFNGKPHIIQIYHKPFKRLLKRSVGPRNSEEKRYFLFSGDLISYYPEIDYTFVKNRSEGHRSNGVLLKSLNQNRHWGIVDQIDSLDCSFSKKKNMAIWRGVTTGRSTKKANRFVLVKKWFHENNYVDVGFNRIVQEPNHYQEIFPNRTIENYKRPSLSPREMLRYKYIISVRGNDKDSGLNWKLASNSVVFMAKPTVTSWLMESDLIPNFHYVLLKDDFSDLKEKIIWANRHPRIVQQISANAKKFMQRFQNKSNEEKIETEVVRRYFSIMEKS